MCFTASVPALFKVVICVRGNDAVAGVAVIYTEYNIV